MADDPAAWRSPELDEVRKLLFPQLPPEQGWSRIELALDRAGDPERLDAIEEIAGEDDLEAELRRRLRDLRDRTPEPEPEPDDEPDDEQDS